MKRSFSRSKLECIGLLPMEDPDIPHELSCDNLLSQINRLSLENPKENYDEDL